MSERNILNEITVAINALSKEEVAEAAAKILARRNSLGPFPDASNADYVLAHSEYAFRGDPPYMSAFRGTFRQLLEDLNGITDENRTELFRDEDDNLLEMKDMTDAQLIELFDDANGDGQPYVMVWSVAEGKKVLG